jgi:hypothetical protein
MLSEQIVTTRGLADNEIIRRHLVVARNEENEISMREHSIRLLEDNIGQMDGSMISVVTQLRASLNEQINKQAQHGLGLAMKRA